MKFLEPPLLLSIGRALCGMAFKLFISICASYPSSHSLGITDECWTMGYYTVVRYNEINVEMFYRNVVLMILSMVLCREVKPNVGESIL